MTTRQTGNQEQTIYPDAPEEPKPLEKLVKFVEGSSTHRHAVAPLLEQFSPEEQGTKQARGKTQTALTDCVEKQQRARELLNNIGETLESGKNAKEVRKLKNELLETCEDALASELELRRSLLPDFLEKLTEEANQKQTEAQENLKKTEESIRDKLRDAGFSEEGENTLPPLEGSFRSERGLHSEFRWSHPDFRAARAAVQRVSHQLRDIEEHKRLNDAAAQSVQTYLEDLVNGSIA